MTPEASAKDADVRDSWYARKDADGLYQEAFWSVSFHIPGHPPSFLDDGRVECAGATLSVMHEDYCRAIAARQRARALRDRAFHQLPVPR
jgi:hypothetical protein